MTSLLIVWSTLISLFSLNTHSPNTQDLMVDGGGIHYTHNSSKAGKASYYHSRFVGRKTSTGETFLNTNYTGASNFFKLGTYVKVTNTANGRVIYVKINDRMGHPSRVIDLTERAARDLRFVNKGLANVTIEEVPASEAKRKILAQREGVMPTNSNTL